MPTVPSYVAAKSLFIATRSIDLVVATLYVISAANEMFV